MCHISRSIRLDSIRSVETSHRLVCPAIDVSCVWIDGIRPAAACSRLLSLPTARLVPSFSLLRICCYESVCWHCRRENDRGPSHQCGWSLLSSLALSPCLPLSWHELNGCAVSDEISSFFLFGLVNKARAPRHPRMATTTTMLCVYTYSCDRFHSLLLTDSHRSWILADTVSNGTIEIFQASQCGMVPPFQSTL